MRLIMNYSDEDLNDCGGCWAITPISLATEDSDLQHQLTALGWGTFDDSGEASTFLRKVELTLNLNKTKGNVAADKYFLWTDVGPEGQDTCVGDSGIEHYLILIINIFFIFKFKFK